MRGLRSQQRRTVDGIVTGPGVLPTQEPAIGIQRKPKGRRGRRRREIDVDGAELLSARFPMSQDLILRSIIT